LAFLRSGIVPVPVVPLKQFLTAQIFELQAAQSFHEDGRTRE
jgi:hypothetical protein